jgi:hypothetical protein
MIDHLKRQGLTEGAAVLPISEPTTSPKKEKSPVKKVTSPKTRLTAQNSRARKGLDKYGLSMKGNKYAIQRWEKVELRSLSSGFHFRH